MATETLARLKERLAEVSDIDGAVALLGWDQRTIMPEAGTETRGRRMATLGRIAHDMFTSDETKTLLDGVADLEQELPFDSDDASLIRVARRDFDDERVIPSDLVVEASLAANEGYTAWIGARATSDYEKLRPALERIVGILRRQVEIYHAAFPQRFAADYDVLLDSYEPGLATSEVKRVFDVIRDATIPLVQTVRERSDRVDDALVHGDFPVEVQRELVTRVAKRLGFDDSSWRLDPTHHPFASSMATTDIRITTRYHNDFLNPALFGTMHEFGHGLYERGVDPALERTPLRRGCSMAFHESQSRMWENLIGRGRPVWTWLLPELKGSFPEQFAKASAEDMYRAVNKLGPSLIRVEADELTYNLHIIIRFELEQDILSGAVDLADLPRAWNDKMASYLGIDVPNDALGVLQDVHWGSGLFGYFPTYALGNVVSLQLWNRIRNDLPDLDAQIVAADFEPLRTWLVEHVHRHGRKYTPVELLERVVGTGSFDPQPLVSYLTAKVEDLYGA